MENNDNKQLGNKKLNGSQFNSVGRFGNSPIGNKDKDDIKTRINSSRGRNLNQNSGINANFGNSHSPLDSGSSSLLNGNTDSSTSNRKRNRRGSSKREAGQESSSKSNGKESPKNNDSKDSNVTNKRASSVGKSLLGGIGNKALDKVSEDNEILSTTVSSARNISFLAKIIRKIISFFMGPWGVISASILGVCFAFLLLIVILFVVINALGMKFGLSGEETLDIFNEEYVEGLDKNQIEDIMSKSDDRMCELSPVQKIKSFFGLEDLTDPCELAHYVKKLIEAKERETRVSPISPGFFMNSLYYSFDTQNRDENGDLFVRPNDFIPNDGSPEDTNLVNDLDAITTLMAANIYKKGHFDDLLDNYLFYQNLTGNSKTVKRVDGRESVFEGYPYYIWTYFPPEEGEEEGHWECVEHQNSKYSVDEFKFKLYLRYGQDVVDSYVNEKNLATAYDLTSFECQVYERPDLSKYDPVADPSTTGDDGAKVTLSNGMTYGYDDGFIFNTYLKYNKKYAIDNYVPYNYKVDKDIEQIINNTESRQDYTNHILGYPSSIVMNVISSDAVCTYNINGIDISNLKVRLANGSSYEAIEGQELIDFEKYVTGVVYAEISGTRETIEASKAQAIAARTYAIARSVSRNKITQENGQWVLTIRNSTNDQVYCDPDKGCHKRCGSDNTVYADGTVPAGTTCETFLGPLPADSVIREAAKTTAGMVLVDKSGNAYPTGYNATIQRQWMDWARQGKNYVEILRLQYGGETTLQTSSCTYGATGDWASWRQYAKEWGSLSVGSSNMKTIGCFITSYAMVLAKSAPKLTIDNFNPGTFLELIKKNGCLSGNVLIANCALKAAVGDGVTVIRAGISLQGKSYSDKVALISNYLNQGYDVVLRVKSPESAMKYNESSKEHWVVVTGINGNNILMADPASDSTVVLDKYHEEGIVYFNYVKFE